MSTEIPTHGITIRKADERGLADFGWLKSRHSFSFGEYYDLKHMGFRSLRVINDDRVVGGAGFPSHPHRDMEIFSYVLDGALAHKDSMGNERILEPGQVQVMSAGRGVTHSEYNPLPDQTTHFLQVWIQPREKGLPPSYTEWRPDSTRRNDPKILMISPDGRDGSALIHQDAEVYLVRLAASGAVTHNLPSARGLWLQVMRGSVALNGVTLATGDGASTEADGEYTITATEASEALLFDLA